MLWICLLLPQPAHAGPPGLAARLLRYTPHLAALDDRTLALEVAGSLRLFGGIRALLRAVRRDCPAGTLTGLGPTMLGACLLARRNHGVRHVLRPDTLARRLDALPCTLLPIPPDSLASLRNLGCRRLGQLRALPRTGLRNRGHAALLDILDQAYGQSFSGNPQWLGDDGGPALVRELTHHSTSAETIESLGAQLIQALCVWLNARQAAIDELTLELAHDDRRVTPAITSVRLRTAQPEWAAGHFSALLRTHLAQRRLRAPVVRITLRCGRIWPRRPRTAPLLLDDSPLPGSESALLDVLRTRLGMDCLRFPAPMPQHIPERTDRWHTEATRPRTLLPRLSAHSRPLWLLSHAVALATPEHHPTIHGAPLTLVAGPERIEGGWWIDEQSPVGRDYFIARDARGARYWIYRDHRGAGWFLHGLFG